VNNVGNMRDVIRPFLLIAFVPTVVLLAVGGAYFAYPSLVDKPRLQDLPTTRDSLLAVPVLMGERDDLRILLRPHYQRLEADHDDDALLSAHLFPGQVPARFVVLWLFNYGSEGPVVFERAASSVLLKDGQRRPVHPLDLPGAVERADLRPDLLLGLKTHEAHSRRIVVPPGTYRRVLLALPNGTVLEDLSAAEVLGIPLDRHEVVRCELEDYLASPADRDSLLTVKQ
jgi:hypothetical protein